MSVNYYYFDRLLGSDRSLPLPIAEATETDLNFVLNAEPFQNQALRHYNHCWKSPCGTNQILVEHDDSGFFISFPDEVVFHITPSGRLVTGFAPQTSDSELIPHLLMNQVLPMAFTLSGKSIFHASAVVIGGRAVLFVGNSGAGKSTLAAAFLSAGFLLLGDDCILIDDCKDRFMVTPNYPSLRLWDDSAEHLSETLPVSGLIRSRLTDKNIFSINVPDDQHSPIVQAPLQAIYLLDETSTPTIQLQTSDTHRAFLALLGAQFRLDIKQKQVIGQEFEKLSNIANRVPIKRLNYPKNYQRLNDVVERVYYDCLNTSTIQAIAT